jgi:hypothetical protein
MVLTPVHVVQDNAAGWTVNRRTRLESVFGAVCKASDVPTDCNIASLCCPHVSSSGLACSRRTRGLVCPRARTRGCFDAWMPWMPALAGPRGQTADVILCLVIMHSAHTCVSRSFLWSSSFSRGSTHHDVVGTKSGEKNIFPARARALSLDPHR